MQKVNSGWNNFILLQNWCESSTKESLLQEVLGDPHSPHMFRVFGSLTNSKEFAQVFNCPLNSPMNPKSKCTFWWTAFFQCFNILFTAFVQWWSSSNILSSYITLNEPWFDMYRNMLVLRHICFAILTNVGFVVSHEHWCYTIKLFLENKDFYICKICFLYKKFKTVSGHSINMSMACIRLYY